MYINTVEPLAKWRNPNHDKVEAFLRQPLEPTEYLSEWVPLIWGISPEERGYRKACINEIHRITGVSVNTINTWSPTGSDFDKCPDYVYRVFKAHHMLNTVRKIVGFRMEWLQDSSN